MKRATENLHSRTNTGPAATPKWSAEERACEACPEDAIRMDTGILDLAAYSREAMQLDIHELMNPELRKPIGDCDLDFPHECEVHDGEMRGDWESVGVPTQEH